MTGVHCLEHVERFATPYLAQDYPVRPHPQCISYQVPLGDLSSSFYVGRPGLQAHYVFLLKVQFGGILDGYDPLRGRDILGQYIEEGRLSGAGPARYEDVEPGFYRSLEDFFHPRVQGVETEHVANLEGFDPEAADREDRPIDGKGGDNGVDPRPIRKPGVNVGRGFIDSSPDLGNNPFNDLHEMVIVPENDVGLVKLAKTLDIDVRAVVDQNVGNIGIGQQRLDGSQAEGFMLHLHDEPLDFLLVQRHAFLGDQALDDITDFGGKLSAAQEIELAKIEPLYKLSVNAGFQLLVISRILARTYFFHEIKGVLYSHCRSPT